MEVRDWIIVALLVVVVFLAFGSDGRGKQFFCEKCARACGPVAKCNQPYMEGYAPRYTNPRVTGYGEGMNLINPEKIITQDMVDNGELKYDEMLYK